MIHIEAQEHDAITIYRPEDNELLGYITKSDKEHLWVPVTLFGYPLAEPLSKEEATTIVQNRGLASLMETWQFYDEQEEGWFNCIITEAQKYKLTVQISDYDHPDIFAMRVIQDPSIRTFRLKPA